MTSPVPGQPIPISCPRIVNCTSHIIRIYFETPGVGEPDFIEIPSSGALARLSERKTRTAFIRIDSSNADTDYEYTLPVCEPEFGDVIGLPDPAPNTIYLVSRMVCEALPERRDLYYPDDSIRDTTRGTNNRQVKVILGCRCLSQASLETPRTETKRHEHKPFHRCRSAAPHQRPASHRH